MQSVVRRCESRLCAPASARLVHVNELPDTELMLGVIAIKNNVIASRTLENRTGRDADRVIDPCHALTAAAAGLIFNPMRAAHSKERLSQGKSTG